MACSQNGNKITWVFKDFSQLKPKVISSDQFMIGGYKWHLQAYPNGKNGNIYFCLDLELDDCESLPFGWKRPVQVSFALTNIIGDLFTKDTVTHWFSHKERSKGVTFNPVVEYNDKKGRFQVCRIIEIEVEVDVYETAPKLDRSKAIPLQFLDVNGFQVLSSQEDFARRIFDKYPDIALRFSVRNQGLRTSYMNMLLCVTKTLFKVPQEQQHSTETLSQVEAALAYLKSGGFKTDWLEKKLDEEKKKCGKVTDLEKQLNGLMKKQEDLKSQLHLARAEILKPRVSDISFDDVF